MGGERKGKEAQKGFQFGGKPHVAGWRPLRKDCLEGARECTDRIVTSGWPSFLLQAQVAPRLTHFAFTTTLQGRTGGKAATFKALCTEVGFEPRRPRANLQSALLSDFWVVAVVWGLRIRARKWRCYFMDNLGRCLSASAQPLPRGGLEHLVLDYLARLI